jgi:hypothetical protein
VFSAGKSANGGGPSSATSSSGDCGCTPRSCGCR